MSRALGRFNIAKSLYKNVCSYLYHLRIIHYKHHIYVRAVKEMVKFFKALDDLAYHNGIIIRSEVEC
jgi:hypothetical protein